MFTTFILNFHEAAQKSVFAKENFTLKQTDKERCEQVIIL